MIGKIKNYLGIESVKIEIDIPDEINADDEIIVGKLIILSQRSQVINSIEIKLVENYQRGRGKKKLINDYTAGLMTFNKAFKVEANSQQSFE